MSKKQTKKAKPTGKGQGTVSSAKELSDDQLKGVTGGMGAAGGTSFFRSVGGLKTETDIVEFGNGNAAELIAPADPFSKR